MSAIDDLRYYRDKGGMGLSALSVEQRAVIELDEKIEILFAALESLEASIQALKDRLNFSVHHESK